MTNHNTDSHGQFRAALLAIALLVFIAGFVNVFRIRAGVAERQRRRAPVVAPRVSAASVPRTTQTVSRDGIDVTVDEISRAEGKTVIRVTMNNHQFDLTDSRIKERSSLDGVVPERFSILSSGAGGHHVEAELAFADPNGRAFRLGVTESLTFDIELPL